MTKKEKDEILRMGEEEKAGKRKKKPVEEPEPEEEEEEESFEEEEEESDESEEEEDESDDSDEDIDYEEIARLENERAETEREAKEKAEKALAKKAFNKRKKKRDGEEDEEEESDDEEDQPLTRRDLRSVFAEISQETTQKNQEAEALTLARKFTKSEKEAQAAIVFYKNRIRHTGNVVEDIQFAIAGMNRKKTVAEKSEIVRSLKSKDGSSKDFAGTHRQVSNSNTGKLNSAEANALKASGMEWDAKKRVYKKPLNGGKEFFYYDPKTKKRWKGK